MRLVPLENSVFGLIENVIDVVDVYIFLFIYSSGHFPNERLAFDSVGSEIIESLIQTIKNGLILYFLDFSHELDHLWVSLVAAVGHKLLLLEEDFDFLEDLKLNNGLMDKRNRILLVLVIVRKSEELEDFEGTRSDPLIE